jgi:hypothetical protein
VEGKSYSQRSCCNSENPSSYEKTCSASLIDETLPPTTAGPSEPSPAPTKDYDSDKINIIIASIAAVAAVLTVVTGVVQMRRESNTGAIADAAAAAEKAARDAAAAAAASSATSIDVDFVHYLVSSSVNNGASVPLSVNNGASMPLSVNEGGLVNTSENDNNGTSVPPS